MTAALRKARPVPPKPTQTKPVPPAPPAATGIPDLPPEFDLAIYAARHPDLQPLSPDQQAAHYVAMGQTEGRVCSQVDQRDAFLALVPRGVHMLEIGPYTKPTFLRPDHDVRYLDAFSTEQLKEKAVTFGFDPATVPEIDFVWTGQSYAELIRDQLQVVYSSHNIEHQPDLVRHLQQLHTILEPGGLLFLVVPDRRYCFDYFLPDTTFADVLSAYYDRRIKHVAGCVLEHRMMTTHNEVKEHWAGNHGAPLLTSQVSEADLAHIASIRHEVETTGGYIDTHAWRFTPTSFRGLVQLLRLTGMIGFDLERLYPTLLNSSEFYAVLRKA